CSTSLPGRPSRVQQEAERMRLDDTRGDMERNSALPYLDLAETLQARMLADQACASDGTLGVLDAHIVTLEQALAKAEALSEQRLQEAEAATNRGVTLGANTHGRGGPVGRAEAFADQRRQEAEASAERIGALEADVGRLEAALVNPEAPAEQRRQEAETESQRADGLVAELVDMTSELIEM